MNKDNARISYGYLETILLTQRKYKLNVIMWSNEIQEKLNRRQLEVENRMNKPKWFITNKMIMNYSIKYTKWKELKEEILALLNQIRIYK